MNYNTVKNKKGEDKEIPLSAYNSPASGGVLAATDSSRKTGQTGTSTGASTGASGTGTKSSGATYNGGYTESSAVSDAKKQLETALAGKPTAYQSDYSQQLTDTLNKILNRDKFAYSVEDDDLYQQYKAQYMREGKNAMEDTVGQLSGMTGGYGSSYAVSAGQGAYNAYLDKLNDKVPELYQAAYDRYNQEGTDLKDAYAILRNEDDTGYNRYRDTVSDYNTDVDRATDTYNNARNVDYSAWGTGLDQQYRYASMAEEAKQNEIDNKYRYDALNEDKRQFDETLDENKRQFDADQEQKTADRNAEYGYKYASLQQDNDQFNATMDYNKGSDVKDEYNDIVSVVNTLAKSGSPVAAQAYVDTLNVDEETKGKLYDIATDVATNSKSEAVTGEEIIETLSTLTSLGNSETANTYLDTLVQSGKIDEATAQTFRTMAGQMATETKNYIDTYGKTTETSTGTSEPTAQETTKLYNDIMGQITTIKNSSFDEMANGASADSYLGALYDKGVITADEYKSFMKNNFPTYYDSIVNG